MTCRDLAADLVDLARGEELGAARASLVADHLDRCAHCAARLVRERELTAALKAVAAEAPPSTRASAIEAQLLAAFAAQAAATPVAAEPARARMASPSTWGWLAAAAVLVLAVAVWQGAGRTRSGAPTAPSSMPASSQAAVPAAPANAAPAEAAAPAQATTIAGPPASRGHVTPEPARAGQAPRAPQPRDSDVLQFVALPTAIGLPPIESGRIVRVEVPTAMLPAYGFDVTPDAGSGLVEADVLVGQDGQPRAIRFVTLETDARRRQ